MVVRAASAILVVLLVSGCAPSLRRVARGGDYFERCYAADFDSRIPASEKHDCWTAWQRHYTIGQAPDRVRYAADRVRALDAGESVPLLPGLPEAAIGPRAATPVMAVSAEPDPEPEPPAAEIAEDERLEAPRRRTRHPPRLPRASNPTCAMRACETSWRACAEACPEREDACETACEVEMHACARGCF